MTAHNNSISNAGVGEAIVLLTGPTSGLGLAIFNLLRSRAAVTIAAGRHIHRLADAAGSSTSPDVILVEADFGTLSTDQWIDAIKRELYAVLDAYPRRTLVFLNNAGTIEPLGGATDLDLGAIRRATQINFIAPVAIATMMVRLVEQTGHRFRIVNITTGAAKHPIAGWLAYCASKAACQMAFDVMAMENPILEMRHIDPGVIDTGMQARVRATGKVTAQGLALVDQVGLKSPASAAADVLARAWGEAQ